jgi:uncharacterized lipoprotein YmbA
VNGNCRVLACLIGALVGCTSAPIHYYTLTLPPDVAAPAQNASVTVDVRVSHMPPQLNRTELMVRAGPSEVVILDNERWASPVKDEIKDALRIELQRRLGAATDLRSTIAKLTVTVDVQHFEAELGRHALIEASWSLESQAATCTFRSDARIASGHAAMVNGYQRDIAALADAVVAELRASADANDAPCGQTSGR